MGNGRNLISDHLGAFSGGSLVSFGLCIKPILLDTVSTTGYGILALVGIYAFKLLITAIVSAAGGLGTAWGADIYKNWKEYRRARKERKEPFSKNGKSKDKAA